MATYTTNLKTWGSTGTAYSTGYAYTAGEPPVDEWDNFIMHNVVEDIKHLVQKTNNIRSEAVDAVESKTELTLQSPRLFELTLDPNLGAGSSTITADYANAATLSWIGSGITVGGDAGNFTANGDIRVGGAFKANNGAGVRGSGVGYGVELYTPTGSTLKCFDNGATGTARAKAIEDFDVGNDFSVTGNKDFTIPHPSDPENKELRHASYEGPTTGGLIYRNRVTTKNGEAVPDFPDYILNNEFGDDWVTAITPVDHFGSAYLDTDTWTVHADTDGEYDVVIFGRRTDDGALTGRGPITEKSNDDNWNESADKFHKRNSDIQGVESAKGGGKVEQNAGQVHAKKMREKEKEKKNNRNSGNSK